MLKIEQDLESKTMNINWKIDYSQKKKKNYIQRDFWGETPLSIPIKLS